MLNLQRSATSWLLASLCLCATSLLGCSGGAEQPGGTASSGSDAAPTAGATRRLIVLTNGNSPFWDACRAGIEDAQKELKLGEAGFSASMEVNDGSVGGQIAKLRQYDGQPDIAGIAISAIDAKNAGVAEILEAFQKKGVAIVTIDSDVDRTKFRSARTAFIGTDNLRGGVALGECAKILLPEGGEYVTFDGSATAQNAQERVDGFGLGAGDSFLSKDKMSDAFDGGRARENVRNALSNHADLKALVGIYSYNAPAIVDVVKEQNKRANFKICTFDAEPIAIKNMADGMIDVMVVQNPYQMGYQGVACLKAILTKDEATLNTMLPKLGEEGGDLYDTGIKVVVPDDKSPIKADALSGKVEFLTLSEFQAWMKKYNLTGS